LYKDRPKRVRRKGYRTAVQKTKKAQYKDIARIGLGHTIDRPKT
jgi:hypothetical protein